MYPKCDYDGNKCGRQSIGKMNRLKYLEIMLKEKITCEIHLTKLNNKTIF